MSNIIRVYLEDWTARRLRGIPMRTRANYLMVVFSFVALSCHIIFGVSSKTQNPSSYHQPGMKDSFSIEPRTCAISNQSGICMFVWKCIREKGVHLGMCKEGFMFGSCCQMTATSILKSNLIETDDDNVDVEVDEDTVIRQILTSTSMTILPLKTTTTNIDDHWWNISNHVIKKPSRPSRPTKPSRLTIKKRPQSQTKSTATITTTTTIRTSTTKKKPASHIVTWKAPSPLKKQNVSSLSHDNHRPSYYPLNNSEADLKNEIVEITTKTAPKPSAPTRPTRPPKPSMHTTSVSSTIQSTTKTTTIATVTVGTRHPVFHMMTAPALSTTRKTTIRPSPVPSKDASRLGKNICGIPSMTTNCPTGRIVNGSQSCYGQFPWQVSVRRSSFFGFSSTHRCGGALINEMWIATAGHCVDDLLVSKIRVRIGEWDFSTTGERHEHVERKVSKKIVHPKYNFFTYENDLALVRLEKRVTFRDNIIPICLPGNDDQLVGETAIVAGWGRLSEGGQLPNILQYVQVPIVSNEKCKAMFLKAGRHEVIPEIFMCAGYDDGGKDSCQGDSGGPLIVKGYDGRMFLGGIISWGIGCAEANLPGVCTRISYFREWILSKVT